MATAAAKKRTARTPARGGKTKAQPSTARKGRKASAKTAPVRRRTAKRSHPGIYTVARGHVSVAVPPFWTLRQTNEDLEVEAPSESTSVIITAFQHDKGAAPTPDAREFLERFMETAPRNGRIQMEKSDRRKASARYRDSEGDSWRVMFLTNGRTLLMATCNSTGPATSREARTGLAVLESLKLKARE